MARKSPQPKATSFEVLECVQQNCPSCSKLMWNEYNNLRHVRTLKGVVKLLLKIRRCQNISCERYRIKYRPEQEASAIATTLHSFTAQDLTQVCGKTWQQLRSDLRQH